MQLKMPSASVVRYPGQTGDVADILSARQAELMTVAVKRAADDAGAAVAHQLGEPLTVLLLYLHDLRRRCDLSGQDPETFRATLDMALRSTEQACEILELAGHNVVAPTDMGAAVARGSEAIDLWKRTSAAARRAATGPVCTHPLTAREREVLTLVTDGASNKRGGQMLGISTRTFETHRANVMRKIGARNTADLIRIALSGT